ncbi:hypothetical protein BKA65DRAFT_525083 [Rhexocercosporidium sp. MPI-PUGE-AT-0058]|nr:hypothetical protein BKA65DRAFT_525083 [Rhexocercosporidium sp. MPI-PUGE-AT-0058]
MPPTIILIRHAEALHKLGKRTQCAALSESLQTFPLSQDIGLIVVSPMTRALQTADNSLGWLMKQGVSAIPQAEWQENTVNNIDIGRPVAELEKGFPQFDWTQMDPALTERGVVARTWLHERKEKVIAVISHDGFMRVGICQRKFGNADYRVFDFEENGLGLVEWKSAEENGGGLGTSPKGHFGWLPNDFKYMPKNTATTTETNCEITTVPGV